MISTKLIQITQLPTDLTRATTTEIDFSSSWADDARAAEEGLVEPATHQPAVSAQEDGDGALASQQVSQRG